MKMPTYCPKREIPVRLKSLFVALVLIFTLGTGLARAADQKTFATPIEAVHALVKATGDGKQEEILSVLGEDSKELVYSGDPVQDKTGMDSFLKAYKTKHALLAPDEKTRVLQIGPNSWEMPIPIVNDGGKWRFDTAAGKEDLLYRRIGHNELGAIAACRGYIDAQKDYASADHDGLPPGTYAQKLMSSPGKQDGLYWEAAENDPASPAGPLLAQANAEGYESQGLGGKVQPYHGYFYRILKAQGAAAKGGAKSYLTDGQLTGGGFSPEFLRFFSATHQGQAACGMALLQRSRMTIEDVAHDPIFAETPAQKSLAECRSSRRAEHTFAWRQRRSFGRAVDS